MKKRVLTSAAALLVAFGLFACGGEKTPDGTSQVPTSSKTQGGSEKHEHTFDETKWESNESYHWHAATCEHTSQTKDKQGHQWGEAEVIKAATCDEAGSQKKTCKTCGYVKTEEIAAKGHDYKDASSGEDFGVAKCECGSTILSRDWDPEAYDASSHKWNKGKETSYAFSNAVASKGKLIIGAKLSSSAHTDRSFYVNHEGASTDDKFESSGDNDGICRIDVKVNGDSLNIYQGTYQELGLGTDYADVEIADVTLPAGTFTITIATNAQAGYRLCFEGKVSVSVDKYQKA